MGIGKRMRKLLKDQGRKQKWLAEKVQMSEGNLQRILDDKQAPSAENLAGFATALEVSTDFLLGLTGNQAG